MKNAIITVAAVILILSLINYTNMFYKTLVIKAHCSTVARECAAYVCSSGKQQKNSDRMIRHILKENKLETATYKIYLQEKFGYRKAIVIIVNNDIRGKGVYKEKIKRGTI